MGFHVACALVPAFWDSSACCYQFQLKNGIILVSDQASPDSRTEPPIIG